MKKLLGFLIALTISSLCLAMDFGMDPYIDGPDKVSTTTPDESVKDWVSRSEWGEIRMGVTYGAILPEQLCKSSRADLEKRGPKGLTLLEELIMSAASGQFPAGQANLIRCITHLIENNNVTTNLTFETCTPDMQCNFIAFYKAHFPDIKPDPAAPPEEPAREVKSVKTPFKYMVAGLGCVTVAALVALAWRYYKAEAEDELEITQDAQ